ncbi:hypothetical protein HYPP_01538 [Hyphomicrobium sp. ghe19]|nr:hypothetical protein HYPP_01538 [Hyphomicrobium sp. ghe19]
MDVPGVLLNHEGRISSTETLVETLMERKPERPRFEVKDLASFLPGAIALLLALLGKITWLQFLGATGSGH